jgi:glycine cleavage system regulatory protein
MRMTLVMTIIGPDRTGLVDALARPIAEHNGNWLESRMCRLGGQFAGIVRVGVESREMDALRYAIDAIKIEGLQITVQSDPMNAERVTSSMVSGKIVRASCVKSREYLRGTI